MERKERAINWAREHRNSKFRQGDRVKFVGESWAKDPNKQLGTVVEVLSDRLGTSYKVRWDAGAGINWEIEDDIKKV